MCRISSQLHLCTCHAASLNTNSHYWTFHRYDKQREEIIMGCIVPPVHIDPAANKYNADELLRILNEQNPFDTDLHPTNRDRLALHFAVKPGEHISYGFRYKNKSWVAQQFDHFEWYWHHKEEAVGPIQNALSDISAA